MNHRFWFRRPIYKFCLGLSMAIATATILIFFQSQTVVAQSDVLLNSDLIQLRNRIYRLENERNLNKFSSPNINSFDRRQNFGNSNFSGVVNGQTIGRSDPMFENLANLVIELKQDVKKLNDRVQKLESKIQ